MFLPNIAEGLHFSGFHYYYVCMPYKCITCSYLIATHGDIPFKSCSIIFTLNAAQVCRNINQIKICMETGRTVILLNLENLYESLYDVLNQVCIEVEYLSVC